MNLDLIVSIVAYRNDPLDIKTVLASVLNTSLNIRVLLVDNSPSDDLRFLCRDERIDYIFSGENLGFGGGHNLALRLAEGKSEYHLVLNPDVSFGTGILETLSAYMN